MLDLAKAHIAAFDANNRAMAATEEASPARTRLRKAEFELKNAQVSLSVAERHEQVTQRLAEWHKQSVAALEAGADIDPETDRKYAEMWQRRVDEHNAAAADIDPEFLRSYGETLLRRAE